MSYKKRIVEHRSSQIGVTTYRLPTRLYLHKSMM